MKALGRLGMLAVLAVAIGLQACSSGPSGPPVPESYGLYARDDYDLTRLDGNPEWERKTWSQRTTISPRSEFIAYDRTLADSSPDDTVMLQRVAWVRYQVKTGAESDVHPVGEWAATDLPRFRVPLAFRSVDGNGEMIEARPVQTLPQGLYSLKLRNHESTTVTSRFGVGWDGVDGDALNLYRQETCVDRYVNGPKIVFKACRNEVTRLEIEDIQLSRATIDGVPTILVSGAVRNVSGQVATVPPLRVTATNVQGGEIKSWNLATERGLLPPGESTAFSTTMSPAPSEAVEVSVDLTVGPRTADAR